jgi:hypothetical protein
MDTKILTRLEAQLEGMRIQPPLSPLIRFYFWLGRRDSSVRILQGTACQGWKITIARGLSEIRRPGSASATPLGLGK